MIDSEIQNCITRFAESLRDILGDGLLSVFLYGSLTLGDYKEGWSDLDLIAFTSEPILSADAEKLLMLRQALVASENDPLFRKIEGAVVALGEFRKAEYTRLVYWGTSGQRITDRFTFDVFSMLELIKYGKLICGADVREDFTLPTHLALREGVRQHYDTIREYGGKTGESIYSCGWLLDTARSLYTLRFGDVIGKTQAGEWALKEKLCPAEEEMQRTLEIRKHPKDFIDLPETKAWLSSLGPAVQSFADVLEKELSCSDIGRIPCEK